jgi:hypothetical protein
VRAEEFITENLRKWFKEKWVRFGPDGKIRGACARGDDSEGKPKCLPQAKAHALGKKGRKYAASKKRREDPNPERRGPAKNVATKKKSNESITEISDKTKQSYKEKATQQVKDLKPHAKKGEYKDIAQRAIDRRERGLERVKDVDEGQIYMGGNKPAGMRWYKPRSVPNQNELSKESAIEKGLQVEGNDEEYQTGGGLGMPYPGTYEQETKPFKSKGPRRITAMTYESQIDEKWSNKYKKSIDCNNPKGFSQKAHCQGRKKD